MGSLHSSPPPLQPPQNTSPPPLDSHQDFNNTTNNNPNSSDQGSSSSKDGRNGHQSSSNWFWTNYIVPDEVKAFIPGIILAILVILIVWLLLKMYRRLFTTQSRSNNTIVQPTTFKAGTDVREWLEKFELYANANNIYDKHEKGKALLSRLDEETLKLIKLIRRKRHVKSKWYNISSWSNDEVVYDYPSMVKFMLELYDTAQSAPIDYLQHFANLVQGDLSISFYYAKILEYGENAFPTAVDREKDSYMKNQFIKVLRSENIRNQIRMEDNANRTLEDVKELARKYENTFSNLVEKPIFSPSLTSNVSRSRDNSANRVSFDQKKCDYCHRNNHSESECRTKIRDLERSAPSNQSQSKPNQMPNQPQNQPQYQQQSNQQQGQTQYQQPSQQQYQQPNQQQYQQPSQQYNQHPNQNAPQMANFNGRNVNGSFCSAKQVETEIYFKSNNSTDPSIKKLIDEIGGVCLIDGKEVNFMADTGCTLTVVDKRVLADQNGVIANMEPSPYTCIIADGQPTAIMGQKRVKITVGNNKSTYHNVLISPHLAKDCLLGLDVLESCPLTKDLLQELRTRLNGTKKDKKSISSIFKNMIMFLSVGLLLNPILLNVATAVHETQTKIINKLNTIANDIIYALESIAAQGFESLGRTNVLSHFIEIEPGTEPIRQKMRKVPQAFENEFKTTIQEMIKHGLIRASRSPWSSPVRLVRKKDGSMRITVDYRKLNGVTIKDAYPIPNINNMFNHLTKGRLFTTLDLHSGYFQLPMDPDSSQYTAFTCEFGFFEYVVMPQGLCNATATFQRAMTLALGDLIGKICYCYLDDVIIFSEDPDQHLEHVKMVRDRLKQHNLKIKMSKCKFAQTKIEYLSHVICNGQI